MQGCLWWEIDQGIFWVLRPDRRPIWSSKYPWAWYEIDFLALREELRKNPNRFKGNKILFMHTGGIFGFIDGTMTDEIKKTNPVIDLDTIIDY